MRKALLFELGLKPPENEQNLQEDPYLILGYGVNAYMEIVAGFGKLYCALTFITLPLMLLYNFYGEALGGSSSLFLGNLGSADMFC